jgi:hypothetical protein
METSDLHNVKHNDPTLSTFRGISIDESADDDKAKESIHFDRELNSSEND